MARHPEDGTLPLECFAFWAEHRADKDFLIQPMPKEMGGEVKHFTWQQVNDQARRMAAYLKAQDFPEKSQIAIMSQNCAWWIIADLAIWMAGHVSVPLYPTLNAKTVEHILTHSDSRLLFVGKLGDWDDMKAGVPDDMPTIAMPIHPEVSGEDKGFTAHWEAILQAHEPLDEVAKRAPDEMATIVYTSGSTGMPKGVMLSFAAMQNSPQHGRHTAPMNEDDRFLSYLPLAHVLERALIEQGALYSGVTIYFNDSLQTFAEDLRRARPTLFASVPRLWVKFQSAVNDKMPPQKQKRLMKVPIVKNMVKKKILTTLGLDEVRFALTGSAPLPGSVIEWYRTLGLELLEAYGMSENFGYSHCNIPGKTKVGTVGNASHAADHKIAENGEILVKSPCNMMGYYKQPDKTKEELTEDGWLHTGDMGQIDDAGRLKITGRVKELFKTSKGKYVAPAPIENKLQNHPAIEVVCVSGANQGQPHCMVLLSEEASKSLQTEDSKQQLAGELEELIGNVNETLDHHEHVEFAVIVNEPWSIDNGFLTPTLKIKRNVLEDHYAAKVDDWYAARQRVIWQ